MSNVESTTKRAVTEGAMMGVVGGGIVGAFAGGPLGAIIGAFVGGAASAGATNLVDRRGQEYASTSHFGAADEVFPNPYASAADGGAVVASPLHAGDTACITRPVPSQPQNPLPEVMGRMVTLAEDARRYPAPAIAPAGNGVTIPWSN